MFDVNVFVSLKNINNGTSERFWAEGIFAIFLGYESLFYWLSFIGIVYWCVYNVLFHDIFSFSDIEHSHTLNNSVYGVPYVPQSLWCSIFVDRRHSKLQFYY